MLEATCIFEGVDFFETYTPVVQWTTIWLMFILEVLLGLKSKQGNVTCAFLHADLAPDETVYVDMPLGCVLFSLRLRQPFSHTLSYHSSRTYFR